MRQDQPQSSLIFYQSFVVMAESTSCKPTDGIPKSLQNILDLLVRENDLRSWQVYSEKFGVEAKIRFGHHDGSDKVKSATNSDQSARLKYGKKSPCQRDERRATERRITRGQKKDNTMNEDMELPRNDDSRTMNTTLICGAGSPFAPSQHSRSGSI